MLFCHLFSSFFSRIWQARGSKAQSTVTATWPQSLIPASPCCGQGVFTDVRRPQTSPPRLEITTPGRCSCCIHKRHIWTRFLRDWSRGTSNYKATGIDHIISPPCRCNSVMVLQWSSKSPPPYCPVNWQLWVQHRIWPRKAIGWTRYGGGQYCNL